MIGMNTRQLLLGLIILFFLPSASECREPQETPLIQNHAYNALRTSKQCEVSGSQSITCTYKVENTLVFSIEGIGEVDAAVTFNLVTSDSLYYARFASRPRMCIDSTQVQ